MTGVVHEFHARWTCPVCGVQIAHPRGTVVGAEAEAHLARLHEWDPRPSEKPNLGDVMVRYPLIDLTVRDLLLDALIDGLRGRKVDIWSTCTSTEFYSWAEDDWFNDADDIIDKVSRGLPRRWFRHDGVSWRRVELPAVPK